MEIILKFHKKILLLKGAFGVEKLHLIESILIGQRQKNKSDFSVPSGSPSAVVHDN